MEGFIEEVRKYKIPGTGGMVIFDYAATILGSLLIAKIYNFNFVFVLILLLVASIPLHILFSTPTMTNYYLGLSKRPKK